MSSARLGLLRCALAALLFGASTPVAARLADDTSAPVLAGLLYLGAAASVLTPRRRPPVDRVALRVAARPLAVAVLAGGLVGPLLLLAGLRRTSAPTATLLLNSELVATTVLAAVLFREHIGRRVIAGNGLVVGAGAMLVAGAGADLRVGGLLVVGACACWGLDNCVTASLEHVAPEHLTLLKGLVAGTTNLAAGLAAGGALPDPGPLAVALLVGALGYGMSITLWVQGARDVGAARGQLVFSSAPFLGVAVAWLVLGDPATGAQLLAVALAGAGVLLATGSGHDHAHEHEAVAHAHEHAHDDGHHDHRHDQATAVGVRHVHHHVHARVVHVHPHVPDVHHRHAHP